MTTANHQMLPPLYRPMLALNAACICAILVLNYFYQSLHFSFTLKCVCSGLFAALGGINLVYALATKRPCIPFHIAMATGLVLAMLGDVTIGAGESKFLVGAGMFALGHGMFVVAYCFLQKTRWLDVLCGGSLFLPTLLFLLCCPLLDFGSALFQVVCVVYALIISAMLGKAVGNFIRQRKLSNGLMAIGSALFFFSDLMLLFDWFIGLWNWTDNACMGAYYPALCLLALAMLVKMGEDTAD